ncbi:small subunit ribosomal protein S5e, partial [Clonorchis sinensis]
LEGMTYLDTEPEIRLFGKWSADEVSVSDLSLTDHITVKGKGNPILPHTAGRYQVKRFRKAQCPLIERVCCSLMMHGRNNGKKLKALNILKHTFEIIHLLSGENPIQVLVNAILNSGAREDSTRIGRGGTVRRQAVDVSPLRRVNQAIYLLCTGAREAAFRNVKTIAECLADELLNAAKLNYAMKAKGEQPDQRQATSVSIFKEALVLASLKGGGLEMFGFENRTLQAANGCYTHRFSDTSSESTNDSFYDVLGTILQPRKKINSFISSTLSVPSCHTYGRRLGQPGSISALVHPFITPERLSFIVVTIGDEDSDRISRCNGTLACALDAISHAVWDVELFYSRFGLAAHFMNLYETEILDRRIEHEVRVGKICTVNSWSPLFPVNRLHRKALFAKPSECSRPNFPNEKSADNSAFTHQLYQLQPSVRSYLPLLPKSWVNEIVKFKTTVWQKSQDLFKDILKDKVKKKMDLRHPRGTLLAEEVRRSRSLRLGTLVPAATVSITRKREYGTYNEALEAKLFSDDCLLVYGVYLKESWLLRTITRLLDGPIHNQVLNPIENLGNQSKKGV